MKAPSIKLLLLCFFSLMESGIQTVVTRVKEDLKFLEKTKTRQGTGNTKGFDILNKLLKQ